MTKKTTNFEYTILFTQNTVEDSSNTASFNNVCDFIDWFFQNKKQLKNTPLNFKNEIDNLNLEDVENIYKFLMFYMQAKKDCDFAMQEYNKKLLKQNNNEEITKALNEFIRMNGDGKFLRAALVGLGYKSTDKDDNDYLNLALALEVFQTSILIHDDIIDKAVVRRGKDTIPVSYGRSYSTPVKDTSSFKTKKQQFVDSMGICIGDLGFYLANQIIVDGYKDSDNLAKILSYYHSTAIKTCKGEMIDVILPFKEAFFETDKDLEEKIMDVYKLKTAWYSVIGPYCLGLILGGAKEENVKVMEDILLNIGIAFQIKDDLLGIYGDEKHIGKSTNSDIEEYKQTILYAYVMKTEYNNELFKYYGQDNLTKDEINKVKDIFEISGAKKYATDTMDNLFKESAKALENIEFLNNDIKDILKGFVVYLQNRSK